MNADIAETTHKTMQTTSVMDVNVTLNTDVNVTLNTDVNVTLNSKCHPELVSGSICGRKEPME